MTAEEHQITPSLPHPILEFNGFNLALDYTYLLRSLNFTLQIGESMAVLGPVGSGKSMLLKTINQLVWHHADLAINATGTCRFIGEDLFPPPTSIDKQRWLQSQVIHLDEHSVWLPTSIEDNFSLAQRFANEISPKPYLEIIDGLPLTGRTRMRLASVANLLPQQIESPTLQLLAMIRALMRQPQLILLDDPFLRMDPILLRNAEHLIETQAREASIILATNDLHQASRMTDKILLLNDGCIVEFTDTLDFFTHPKTRHAENFVSGRDFD